MLALGIDTAMLAHYDSSEILLTALGFSTQIVFLLMVFMIGLTVGTVGLVARAFGARDEVRVNHVLAQSTVLTVVLGVGVAVAGNLIAPRLLAVLGASPEVVDAGLRYLRPLLIGTVFLYLTVLYGGVLRGVGNTRIPFMVALLSTAANVGLNVLLIYGHLGFPAMGIRGAAIGTVVSQLISTCVFVMLLGRGRLPSLRLSWQRLAGQSALIDCVLLRQLMRIGAPAALDLVLLNIGFLMLIGMLGRVAEVAVAAHGIGLRIQALAFVPGLSISQATGALVGQALGANDVERTHQVVRASLWLCTIIMSTLAAAIIAGAYPIMAIFDVPPGSSLESYSIEWLYVLGSCMPMAGFHISLAGLLQGSGATGLSLRINFYSTIFFMIPIAGLLGFGLDLGALGIWLSMPLSIALKALLGWLAYKGDRWAKTGLHT